jgi:hypothetical protein
MADYAYFKRSNVSIANATVSSLLVGSYYKFVDDENVTTSVTLGVLNFIANALSRGLVPFLNFDVDYLRGIGGAEISNDITIAVSFTLLAKLSHYAAPKYVRNNGWVNLFLVGLASNYLADSVARGVEYFYVDVKDKTGSY